MHLTASATPIVRFTGNGSNQANYAYAEIEFENADDSASAYTVDASIVVRSSASNGNGGQLCFNTGVEGNSERMRIDSSGRVGINASGSGAIDAMVYSSGQAVLQYGASYLSHLDPDGSGALYLANNVYYNGSNNIAKFYGSPSDY